MQSSIVSIVRPILINIDVELVVGRLCCICRKVYSCSLGPVFSIEQLTPGGPQ